VSSISPDWLAKLESQGATSRGVRLPATFRHPLVIVPLPPSTNALFATVGRRRIVTREYKAWQAVAYPILSMLAPPESTPCEVWLTIRGKKVNRRRDVANVEKALTDGLVACGVLPDDNLKYVVGNHQVYRPDDGEPRVEVKFG